MIIGKRLFVFFLLITSSFVYAGDEEAVIVELTPLAKRLVKTFQERDLYAHLKLGVNKQDVKTTLEWEYKDRLRKASPTEKENVHKRYKKKFVKLDALYEKINKKRAKYFTRAVKKLAARFDMKKYELVRIKLSKHSRLGDLEGAKLKVYFGSNKQVAKIKVYCLKIKGVWKLAKPKRYAVRKVREIR